VSQIVVTGGSGFIGTNLVQYLVDRGDTVLNLDIAPPRNRSQTSFWRPCDLLDRDGLSASLEECDPDYIVHLAARTDLDGAAVSDYAANTAGVENLIAASRSLPRLRRVVFASSMLVCKIGHRPSSDLDYCPTTAYGESKVVGENAVRTQADGACSWVIVRPTSIWGPWFAAPYRDFFVAVRQGRYVHPRHRTVRRSYGFVGNTVVQLAGLLSCPAQFVHGKTLYVADYEPIALKEWADLISEAFGRRKVIEAPVGLLRAAAKVGDVLATLSPIRPPLTTFRLNNMLTDAVYDTRELARVCESLPYTAEQGVTLTVDWLKSAAH
jgi:nucleoside-diphosphate-sugar epimerase